MATRARGSPGSGTWGRAWWWWPWSASVLWRHDRRLLLFGAVGVVAAVLSLGPGHGYWVPWQVLEKVPWVGNIVEIRFTAVLTLCLAVMVTVTIDRSRPWLSVSPIHGVPSGRRNSSPRPWPWPCWSRPLVVLWPNVPLTARAVVLPSWYVHVGADLPPGQGRSLLSASLLRPAVLPGVAGGQPHALGPGRWRRTGRAGESGR